MAFIDTNIMLRFLLNDHAELSAKAAEIITQNDCFVKYEVIAEAVYVLAKVYGVERHGIAEAVRAFLPNVDVENKAVVLAALDAYESTKLDFVDCVLAAHHSVEGEKIFSFDKKLNNFIARNDAEK